MCVEGGGVVGAHNMNQLNVLPFSFTKTDIFHMIAPSLRGCIFSLS